MQWSNYSVNLIWTLSVNFSVSLLVLGHALAEFCFFFSSEFLKMQDGKRGVRGNKQKLGIIDGKGLKVYGETKEKVNYFLINYKSISA